MKKYSQQREAIFRVIENTTSHPSAEWIYERVKKEIPDIGLATVYRNLRLMKAEGKISEIYVSNLEAHFDISTENHYHFHCEKCGRIIDLDQPVDHDIENRVARKTGFKVTHHRLVLGGLCLVCQC